MLAPIDLVGACVHADLVVLNLEYVDVYYKQDHPRHPRKNYAVYGVDVITIATKYFCASFHISQMCGNSNRWRPPGPFVAANKKFGRNKQFHNNDNKWKLLASIRDYLHWQHSGERIVVGYGIKAQITRMSRTFYAPQRGFKFFNPQTRDLWEYCKEITEHADILGPKKPRVQAIVGTVLDVELPELDTKVECLLALVYLIGASTCLFDRC